MSLRRSQRVLQRIVSSSAEELSGGLQASPQTIYMEILACGHPSPWGHRTLAAIASLIGTRRRQCGQCLGEAAAQAVLAMQEQEERR